MDWQMFGAVGEILGAVGVIVSLVYLASGIRASTRATRQDAAQSILRQVNGFIERLAFDSEEVASIWMRGHQGLDHLQTPEEVVRFSGMLMVPVRSMEELFHIRRSGGVEDWTYEGVAATVLNLVSSRGFSDWWELRAGWFGTEFRTYLDAELTKRMSEQAYEGFPAKGVDASAAALPGEVAG